MDARSKILRVQAVLDAETTMLDGATFDGEVIGRYLGVLSAAVQALAEVLAEVVDDTTPQQ